MILHTMQVQNTCIMKQNTKKLVTGLPSSDEDSATCSSLLDKLSETLAVVTEPPAEVRASNGTSPSTYIVMIFK